MAEWLGSGLQSRVRRFDSGPRLQSSDTYGRESLIGYEQLGDWRSWLARLHDTQEVTGSTPVSPTTPKPLRALRQRSGDERLMPDTRHAAGHLLQREWRGALVSVSAARART